MGWVLREQRMAFAPGRATTARRLRVDDRLLSYTTRWCYHRPNRDRGRVIGAAIVESEVQDLDPPVALAGRTFTTGCSLRIDGLASVYEGVDLAPLVPRLSVFPDPRTWSLRMRQPLLATATRQPSPRGGAASLASVSLGRAH